MSDVLIQAMAAILCLHTPISRILHKSFLPICSASPLVERKLVVLQHNTSHVQTSDVIKAGARSLFDCTVRCLNTGECQTISFHHVDNTCSMSSDQGNVEPRADSTYGKIIPLPATDAKSRCGDPPDVANAEMVVDTDTGSISYTCNEGFTNCLGRNSSSCTNSGHWDKMTGLCGQTEWRNLDTENATLPVPCSPSDNVNFTITGTPTEPNSWRIQVRGELEKKEEFNVVDIMISKNRHVMMISIDGKPASFGNRFFTSLVVNRQVSLMISVMKAEFTTYVNGKYKVATQEEPGKGLPNLTHLHFEGHVKVSKVKVEF